MSETQTQLPLLDPEQNNPTNTEELNANLEARQIVSEMLDRVSVALITVNEEENHSLADITAAQQGGPIRREANIYNALTGYAAKAEFTSDSDGKSSYTITEILSKEKSAADKKADIPRQMVVDAATGDLISQTGLETIPRLKKWSSKDLGTFIAVDSALAEKVITNKYDSSVIRSDLESAAKAALTDVGEPVQHKVTSLNSVLAKREANRMVAEQELQRNERTKKGVQLIVGAAAVAGVALYGGPVAVSAGMNAADAVKNLLAGDSAYQEVPPSNLIERRIVMNDDFGNQIAEGSRLTGGSIDSQPGGYDQGRPAHNPDAGSYGAPETIVNPPLERPTKPETRAPGIYDQDGNLVDPSVMPAPGTVQTIVNPPLERPKPREDIPGVPSSMFP